MWDGWIRAFKYIGVSDVTHTNLAEKSWLLLFSRFNVRRDEQWTLTTILELSRNVRTRQHTENVLALI